VCIGTKYISTFNLPINIPQIIKTYSSGTKWYRVWSDGWCEQGGETNKAANISLLKNYINTNYIITTGLNGTGSSGEIPAFNKTTSGFTISHSYVTSNNFMWQASGYTSINISKTIIKY
jgi:hypothetical protein